ncbi:MAG TPA: hypothetical protein DCL35_07240 [Candidatus Omnitrophica bacterium]|nr:hypothetical protein [Candidatus Omnitrophota bacterium]
MIETEYVFSDDVSRLFRISKTTLSRKKWREKKGFPLPRKVGKRSCWIKSDVERWFKGLNG